MDSYDKSIKESCISVPIVDTTIITGNNPQFKVIVRAYQSNYGETNKYIYWYVGCEQPWNDILHPFRHIDIDDDDGNINQRPPAYIWQVLADNELVRLTLKYLVMSDEDLSKVCGHTHVVEYRSQLIRFLNGLWD
jgi:hypothetical protein